MLDFYNSLLDYIFYKKCYFCRNKANKDFICDKCHEKIKSGGVKRLRKVSGIRVEGYYFYKNEVRGLIRGIKYHDKKNFAGYLGNLLVELIGKEFFSAGKTEIIPVPLHYKRQKNRKYNHMELISREISLLTGCKVNTGLIKRIKNTKPQYKLDSTERRENLKDAFKVFPEFYTGKTLILLDDISTTGVTMEALIEELRKHNINNIKGLVIAFVQ